RAELLFGDPQRPAVKRLGLVEVACVLVEHGEVVKEGGDFEVIGAENRFGQRQRLTVERFGPLVPALRAAIIGPFPQRTQERLRFGGWRRSKVCHLFPPSLVVARRAEKAPLLHVRLRFSGEGRFQFISVARACDRRGIASSLPPPRNFVATGGVDTRS